MLGELKAELDRAAAEDGIAVVVIKSHEAEKLGLINRAVPAADLEAETRAMALDIARTPVKHLMILKEAINNFYDNQNLERSARQASGLDAEFHQSPVFPSLLQTGAREGHEGRFGRTKTAVWIAKR